MRLTLLGFDVLGADIGRLRVEEGVFTGDMRFPSFGVLGSSPSVRDIIELAKSRSQYVQRWYAPAKLYPCTYLSPRIRPLSCYSHIDKRVRNVVVLLRLCAMQNYTKRSLTDTARESNWMIRGIT